MHKNKFKDMSEFDADAKCWRHRQEGINLAEERRVEREKEKVRKKEKKGGKMEED